MSRDFGPQIPAAPFVAAINAQIERLAADDTLRLDEMSQEVPTTRILADRLGLNERTVYRYKNSFDGEDAPTDTYPRNQVEDALDRLEIPFEDVYPEIAAAEDRDLEPEAFCGSCHEVVTPLDGCCPWCDRPTRADVPARMYCKREDQMRFPANDGACWRCGGELRRSIPTAECACGCGKRIKRFHPRTGRPARFANGHGKGQWRSKVSLPAGPFVDWLEGQLRGLDPIQSLARRVGVSRDDLLALLNREIDLVTSTQVNRSLRLAAQEGQGQGFGYRPGSLKIGDLYPDRGGALRCPECGGRKTARAELCRACRLTAGWCASQPGRPKSMTPEVLLEARRLRQVEGLTWDAIAERVHPRTRADVASVRSGLLAEFRKRGWSTATPYGRFGRRAA